MELCSIASGSSGNCIYVGNDDTHLMIDAGISGRRIEEGLNQIGLKTSDMSGILVTHEHTDHIGGLGVVARKYGIPIYATGGTIDAIKRSPGTGQISDYLFHEVKPDKRFKVGGMEINPIKVSHDAAEPVAYRFFENGRSAAVMTDLGKFDDPTSCWNSMIPMAATSAGRAIRNSSRTPPLVSCAATALISSSSICTWV